MGRISGIAVFLTALALGSAAFAGAPPDEDLDQFLAGLVDSYEKLHTVSCTVRREVRRFDGASSENVFEYAFKEGRERLDRIETTQDNPGWDTMVWDGKECHSLTTQGGASRLKTVGAIYPHERHMFTNSPVSFCYHFLTLSMHGMVDEDRFETRVLGSDTVRGRPCRILKLRARSYPPDNKACHILYVSADGRYQLLRTEGFLKSGIQRTQNDYIWPVAHDAALPEKIAMRTLHSSFLEKRLGPPPEGQPYIVEEWHFENVCADEQLPDDTFKLSFPPGTLVHDMWSGASYVAGEQSSPPSEKGLLSTDERVLTELDAADAEPQPPTKADAAQAREPEKERPPPPGGEAPPKPRNWILSACAGALIGALLLGVIAWRLGTRASERA